MKGRGACHLRTFRVGRRQALLEGLLNSRKTDSVIAGQSCPASIAYQALRSGWRGVRLRGADIFGTTRILRPIRNRACSLPSPPWPRQTAASGFTPTIETYVALRASVGSATYSRASPRYPHSVSRFGLIVLSYVLPPSTQGSVITTDCQAEPFARFDLHVKT